MDKSSPAIAPTAKKKSDLPPDNRNAIAWKANYFTLAIAFTYASFAESSCYSVHGVTEN